jgi:hypothetical protein
MQAGPGLDALIAERVMGWKRGFDINGSAHGRYFISGGEVYANPVSRLWSPSRDMGAAWEVVEKLGPPFEIRQHFKIGDTAWSVRGGEFIAYASTAPLAICRAALKASQPPLERPQL